MNVVWTSAGTKPAFVSWSNRLPCAELPLATATRLPLRSARVLTADPFGTSTASPEAEARPAEMMAIFPPAAALKIGGVLPTPPTSTAPAFAASSSGGPEVKVDHLML